MDMGLDEASAGQPALRVAGWSFDVESGLDCDDLAIRDADVDRWRLGRAGEARVTNNQIHQPQPPVLAISGHDARNAAGMSRSGQLQCLRYRPAAFSESDGHISGAAGLPKEDDLVAVLQPGLG